MDFNAIQIILVFAWVFIIAIDQFDFLESLYQPIVTGAVIGALIRDCTPKNKAGMFQGLRIVGQVLIPGVVGPAIGAAVLKNAQTVENADGTLSAIPNENIFLAAFIAAIAAWLVLIPLNKLIKKK